MATKKEVWMDNRGVNWDTEATALIEDLFVVGGDDNDKLRTPAGIAAIDALHEYAHRGEVKTQTIETATPRQTLDEIKALRKDDEVMISGSWFRVDSINGLLVQVRFEGMMTTDFDVTELVHVCQGIRRAQ